MGRKRAEKFLRLRSAMSTAGATQRQLLDRWNEEHTDTCKYGAWMSGFFTGKKPFTLDVAYFIMDELGLPRIELGLYFPKDGTEDETC